MKTLGQDALLREMVKQEQMTGNEALNRGFQAAIAVLEEIEEKPEGAGIAIIHVTVGGPPGPPDEDGIDLVLHPFQLKAACEDVIIYGSLWSRTRPELAEGNDQNVKMVEIVDRTIADAPDADFVFVICDYVTGAWTVYPGVYADETRDELLAAAGQA